MFVSVAYCRVVVKQAMMSVDGNATLITFINLVIPNFTWIPSLACDTNGP